MKRVFVTGSSGFIGGHLVQRLVDGGSHVRCLVRPSSRIDLLGRLPVELVRGQLDDETCLEQCVRDVDTVYHVAGLTTVPSYCRLLEVNGWGTERLVRVCARMESPPTVVLVSSIAAAGPSPRHRLRHEDDPAAPISDYGRSKRAGELLALRWAHALPLTIVRPGVVFGPRDRNSLPLFQSIRRFRTHLVPTWDPPRLSLVAVGDLVDILMLSAQKGDRCLPLQDGRPVASRGYYHACMNEHPDYLQLGETIADLVGVSHLFRLVLADPVPWLVVLAVEASRLGPRLAKTVHRDKIREATATSWACTPQRIQDELGFRFDRTLRERLNETVEWYRENGWL